MNTHSLITIGITCFNASDSIGRAIESAQAQDWPHVEILVVDDCSSDNSCAVVAGFDGVRLIRHTENTGPGGARKTLLDNAKGEFLAFFDDDDESAPGRIRIQYERITGYEQKTGASLIACYASGQRVYPNGYTLDLDMIGLKPVEPHGAEMAERILYFGSHNPEWHYGGSPSCALMARTETFKQVGGFDPAFRRVEDLDFAVRLSLAGGYFIGCPEKLFTQHATEGNDKSYEKNLEAELQLAEKHQDYLKSKNRYYYATQWPRLRYYHFKKDYVRFTLTLMGLVLRHPLAVMSHLLRTGPARLLHERKMRKEPA